jgi:release factor glutamine methyltransferase
MTVREALTAGVSFLVRAEVDTPFLDACLLLGETLALSKEALIGAYPREIDADAYACFQKLLRRRGDGVPVSYIRRRKEFYGLEFYVDERVLVPRPDTETLVEEARDLMAAHPLRRILDLGTGSGCLAVTLQRLFPEASVAGADVSAEAGEVFALNATALLGRPLPFILSGLFENVPGTYDLIVSNPPYVADAKVEAMQRAGWPEPALALRGGPDGTGLLLAIIAGAGAHLVPGGFLVLEADPAQMEKCVHQMEQSGYINIMTRRDLGGRERALTGRRPIA